MNRSESNRNRATQGKTGAAEENARLREERMGPDVDSFSVRTQNTEDGTQLPQVTNHKSQITNHSRAKRDSTQSHKDRKKETDTNSFSNAHAHSQCPTQGKPRAVILCGELSGEIYAAGLTGELVSSGMDVYAMGGAMCRRAGAKIIRDYSDLSVVGITEVIENLGRLKRAMRELIAEIRGLKPDVLICVDFPDFNIRIARKVRESVGKLVYFVPPQVWAWRRYRARMLSQLFDRIFVLFPFEVPLFDNGEFHGHPLAERVRPEISESEFRLRYGLPKTGKRVLFLPGSRKREFETLRFVLAETAFGFRSHWPDLSMMILPAPGMPVDVRKSLTDALSPVSVIAPEHKYSAMAAADLAVGASGTVTLECGLSGTPMAVLYRLNPVTTAVGMLAVVSRFISIPNVVLDEAVMAELVNRDCTANGILRYGEKVLENENYAAMLKRRLLELKQRLYREGSFQRVAGRILELI